MVNDASLFPWHLLAHMKQQPKSVPSCAFRMQRRSAYRATPIAPCAAGLSNSVLVSAWSTPPSTFRPALHFTGQAIAERTAEHGRRALPQPTWTTMRKIKYCTCHQCSSPPMNYHEHRCRQRLTAALLFRGHSGAGKVESTAQFTWTQTSRRSYGCSSNPILKSDPGSHCRHHRPCGSCQCVMFSWRGGGGPA